MGGIRGLESLGTAASAPPAPPPLDQPPGDEDEFDEAQAGAEAGAPTQRQFPCGSCGATLTIKLGERHLHCPYCGAEEDLPEVGGSVEEQDFNQALAQQAEGSEMITAAVTHCDGCGAEVTPPDNVDSFACPYCTTPVVCKTIEQRLVQPHGVLPFALDRDLARKTVAKLAWWFVVCAGRLEKNGSYDKCRGTSVCAILDLRLSDRYASILGLAG